MSEDRWFAWLNWLVAVAIALAILFFHGRWLTRNVYTMPLGRCDMIRVWPLPVEQPWWEDE